MYQHHYVSVIVQTIMMQCDRTKCVMRQVSNKGVNQRIKQQLMARKKCWQLAFGHYRSLESDSKVATLSRTNSPALLC